MSTHKPIELGGGNTIQTLLEAAEAYPAILDAITDAKESIRFANYCMVPGEAFGRFGEALAEAAGRGVAVQIMLDRYGSQDTYPQHLAALLEAGVELRWKREFEPRHPFRYNQGLHKKLLIIDNKNGFLGGVGIGDFWLGSTPRYPAAWRDTHFAVTGAVVGALTSAFDQSWEGEKAQPLPGYDTTTPINSQSKGWPQLAPVGKTMLDLIAATTKQLNITTGYFGPSRPIARALRAAARRGVRIRVLTNGPYCTHIAARDAGRHLYGPLLAAGIHIYEYQPTKIHAKVITSDGPTSLIGSANLNFRSLYHDEEFSLLIRNRTLTTQLDEQFEHDLKSAQEITPTAWAQRPAIARIRQATASLARYIF
jgi:cardiolipin synthase A/B